MTNKPEDKVTHDQPEQVKKEIEDDMDAIAMRSLLHLIAGLFAVAIFFMGASGMLPNW